MEILGEVEDFGGKALAIRNQRDEMFATAAEDDLGDAGDFLFLKSFGE